MEGEIDMLEFIDEFEASMEAQDDEPVAVCDLSSVEYCESCQ
jgi:hypothetical protein